MFDGLVNMLVQELRRKPIRPHLCDKKARMALIDKVVQRLMQKCDEKNLKLHEFAEVGEHLPCLNITLSKSDLGPEYTDL